MPKKPQQPVVEYVYVPGHEEAVEEVWEYLLNKYFESLEDDGVVKS